MLSYNKQLHNSFLSFISILWREDALFFQILFWSATDPYVGSVVMSIIGL